VINVHRFLALSSASVVLAACAGGGSSSSTPRSASGTVTPSLAKHPANASLKIVFPKNFIHVPRKGASGKKRSPKFVDPQASFLEIAVTNTSAGSTTSYMAQTDLAISPEGNVVPSGSQTVPVYLAPGSDSIVIAETNAPLGYLGSGYLLAQGTGSIDVTEGQTNSPTITMQLVLAAFEGVQILDQPSSAGITGFQMNPSPEEASVTCYSNGNSVFFLPVDELGNSAVTTFGGVGPGDVGPSDGGIPLGEFTPVISGTSGTSGGLVPNGFGYTIQYDQFGDPFTVSAQYFAVVDPSGGYGPFDLTTTVIPTIAPTFATYSTEFVPSNTAECDSGG